MPEESRKSHDKKKNDAKEQRKPRQRHQQAGADRKVEKKAEEPRGAPKVPQQKPVYETPPPEFFKSLKRETDEILKITEEESSKYKKKEIQSNWTKYEMSIETYDEIEEHENMGADYEKLIQAPLSIGGHFQFKHEKSWDVNTGPSLYDKYFDINMEELNLALCTIPFHERNSIDQSLFTQGDILNMNNRTTRFKQKYYNDKSYATAESEAQDKILGSLREKEKVYDNNENDKDTNNDIVLNTTADNNEPKLHKELEFKNVEPISDKEIKSKVTLESKLDVLDTELAPDIESIEENVVMNQLTENLKDSKVSESNLEPTHVEPKDPLVDAKKIVNEKSKVDNEANDLNDEFMFGKPHHKSAKGEVGTSSSPEIKNALAQKAEPPKESKKSVIESPEDLEKWLDDFLDG